MAFKTLRSYIASRQHEKSNPFSEAINSIKQAPALWGSCRLTFLHPSLSCSEQNARDEQDFPYNLHRFGKRYRNTNTILCSWLACHFWTPTRRGKRRCLTLMKGRRDGKADRWRKRTEDLLVSKPALASQEDKAWHRWLSKEPAGWDTEGGINFT